MVRKEEKRKQREALAAARAAGEDVASDYSSSVGGPSEKSGSKKSKMPGGDQKSAQSPHARSEAEYASQGPSQKPSKAGQNQFSGTDSDDVDDDDGGMDEPMDKIADIPS